MEPQHLSTNHRRGRPPSRSVLGEKAMSFGVSSVGPSAGSGDRILRISAEGVNNTGWRSPWELSSWRCGPSKYFGKASLSRSFDATNSFNTLHCNQILTALVAIVAIALHFLTCRTYMVGPHRKFFSGKGTGSRKQSSPRERCSSIATWADGVIQPHCKLEICQKML